MYVHTHKRKESTYQLYIVMDVLLIDEVSWRMNTQACVNVYIHKRVKRVLTVCSDGGIVDRRGVTENEHTGMC